MGQILNAICDCGYEGKAVLGAGRADFNRVCNFPYHCKSCKEVVSVDLFKKRISCPICNSQDVHTYESQTVRLDKEIYEQLSDIELEKLGLHRVSNEQESWAVKDKNHTLLRGPHHCPKCEKKTLIFFTELMFD